MTHFITSFIKFILVACLLSAVACGSDKSGDTTSEEGNNAVSADMDSSAGTLAAPVTSSVVSAEGTGTVPSRQIQATDGSGGAPGSDKGMPQAGASTATPATATTQAGAKK